MLADEKEIMPKSQRPACISTSARRTALHCYPVYFGVKGRDQRDYLDVSPLPEEVQRPGAVSAV
jgi:hypothetical protein